MSNLDNLIQKVFDDAKIEAGKFQDEANKKRDEIIQEQEDKAYKERDVILKKAQEDAKAQENMIRSNAELKARDSVLSARQDVLDRTFELAKEKLANLGNFEYAEFIKSKLKSLDLKGDEILVVPSGKVDLVKSLGLSLDVSDTQTVDSGFVLADKDVNYNFSFETLIDFQREDLEADIAKSLFK